MNSKTGKLIVMEGPEGSGKTSVADDLTKRLENTGITVERFREPGSTKIGEYIRGILKHNTADECPVPIAELFLFEAARAQLTEQCIEPALKRGSYVVLDRFYDSTTAYQGYGRGVSTVDDIEFVNMIATGHRKPDLTIFLDIDVKTGLERVGARNEEYDRFDEESVEFHHRVRKGYMEIVSKESQTRKWIVVDASGSLDEVCENVWKEICRDVKL